jgi:glycosyltransferase involved in cell wall biosynthesis
MIEAIACGTTAIAYDIGSVPEVIDDGLTSFLVGSIPESDCSAGSRQAIRSRSHPEMLRATFHSRKDLRKTRLPPIVFCRECIGAN